MKPSYRQLAERHARCGPQIDKLIGERDAYAKDATACARALEQALTDAGVDIRLELARLEGAEL